jgi:thiol-disulfide isomerase/thioredoxin
MGCSAPSSVEMGKPAPDFQLPDLDGEKINLSDFKGKPVLLNFWASWCHPCEKEMPYLQQVYEEWPELVVLTVNLGDSPSTVNRFMQSHQLSLPVLLDTKQSLAQKYNVVSIPTTFFIDKDGIARAKIIGSFPSKEAIEKALSQIIP